MKPEPWACMGCVAVRMRHLTEELREGIVIVVAERIEGLNCCSDGDLHLARRW